MPLLGVVVDTAAGTAGGWFFVGTIPVTLNLVPVDPVCAATSRKVEAVPNKTVTQKRINNGLCVILRSMENTSSGNCLNPRSSGRCLGPTGECCVKKNEWPE